MKVLLVNGSPHEKGCTYTALYEAQKVLQEEGIDTELFWIGAKPIGGCLGCGACKKLGRCVQDKDTVNEALKKAEGADGFLFGSPVHYAALSGGMTSFLDRLFYAGSCFANKPGAAIVSCRRGGATAAFDQFIKYFTISNMPVVSSQYWNMVHGNKPEEVYQDLEGIQTVQRLARNMAWLLKCIQAGEEAGIKPPEKEMPLRTNFIR